MTVRAATRERIEAAHRFGAFYRGYLANHLPMALVALDAMGADDARIERYERRHSAHLEALPLDRVAGPAPRFGESADFLGWLAAFRLEILGLRPDAVLGRWIDRLAHAPGSGAFHGLIRTAYALESGSEAELAHALAYWAAAYEPLGDPVALTGGETPADALRAIHAARAGSSSPPGRNIAERMKAAASLDAFDGWTATVAPSRLDLDALAEAALHGYAATNDFTLLHAVTGCHAARRLLPFANDPVAFVAHLWRAIAAAYVAAGAPAFETPAFAAPTDVAWPEILAAAVACEDEHDIKLAYTCWREGQRSGDDLYRRCAAARVGATLPKVS